jgi:uncharacterized membrane protein YhaH (DUF805 family)
VIRAVIEMTLQGKNSPAMLNLLGWMLGLILGLAVLALTTRRFHDMGLSGKIYAILFVLGFVPIVNVIAGIITLVLVLQPSKYTSTANSPWWKYQGKY